MLQKRLTYLLISILIILLSSLALYAGAVIVDFRGEPGNNMVKLKWSTISELKCKGFQIDRSLDKIEYTKIGLVKAAGNSSTRQDYEFEDKTVFKSNLNRTFYYRLKIINTDNSESIYTEIVSVTPSISGARYTWGSIKALFR